MKSSVIELRCLIKASFIAYCILLCVIPAKADVTCTAGKFIAGSQGVVRCDFGKDVTKDKHDFNVVRYDFGDTSYSSSRKNLLACSWYNDQMTCPLKAPGYLFDNRVDSTLTLVIPVMDKSMTGLYRCQLVPKPPNIQMHTCNLTVIETPSPEPSMRTPSETTTLTVNSRSSAESEAAVPATPFIVFSIVFFIVIVVLGLYIIFRRRILWNVRRLQRRFRTRHEHQTGENSVEEALQDVALMDISRDVEYPKNTKTKQTQVYIEVFDKSIQAAGNELGVRFSEKFTQLHLDGERTLITGNLKAGKGDVVLTGSTERFRNPSYSTLGTPPVQLPTKYEETELAKKNSEFNANVVYTQK